MNKPLKISDTEAKNIVLHSQGLTTIKNHTQNIIEQLSYVQIDTISITARCHHHILQTRNPNYNKQELADLMYQKTIFEYWSHAAAYLPIKDYRFSLFKKTQYAQGNKHWFPRDKKIDNYVLDRIKNEGPLQSKDFENPRNKDHKWYDWKPSKIALTNLFMDGTIMIKERIGFQKVFDLTENVLPKNINTTTPSEIEYAEYLIHNAIKAQGLVTIEEICYLRKGMKPIVKKIITNLLAEQQLVEVKIENTLETYYTNKNILKSLNFNALPNQLHLLNPFDNLIIQRKRLKNIFNFDYLIECYVPEKKRIYGYYTIPILYGNNFIGRLDAKADRKTKLLTINHIWLENRVKLTDDFYLEFGNKVKTFAIFCGCDKLVLKGTTPANFKNYFTTLFNC